ncbi:glycerol-3-phosphate 1-O-acyltransferase PlsY [uncultured Litoreibacter sp.]|uniref:glycerol-3-phosphate 1-O-acyltransferase PlsY n=1 Tax=uncultured Litoreibacter sp. TaxID=1392394 RepID=UPI0026179F11|nr:glycerol-3-phosphate 1-O-acyltransferase PlsY [uncultured Litoreibacter sp.]
MPEIVTAPYLLCFIAVSSYLLGSIPFGLVIAKLMGLGDLRKIGSGNIGATNVLRTGSKPAALATLLLDAGKGGIAVILARIFIGEDAAQLAGLMAFLGHIFPVWLNFNGGKGVATYLGTLLGLSFVAGFASCMTWLAFALLFRISSLAALATAALMPLVLNVIGLPSYIVLSALLGALIWMRHAGNIRRILNGTEKKIQFKKG